MYIQRFQLEETPYTKEARSSRHSEHLFSKFLGMSDMFQDLASKFHLHQVNG